MVSQSAFPKIDTQYSAPVFQSDTNTFMPKIDLSKPLFDGFLYRDLRTMFKSLRGEISVTRMMAYFAQQKGGLSLTCLYDELVDRGERSAERLELQYSLSLSKLERLFAHTLEHTHGIIESTFFRLDLNPFYKACVGMADALARFDLLKYRDGDYGGATRLLGSMCLQSLRPRLLTSEAWFLVPPLVQIARDINAGSSPVKIGGIFIFGSMTRDLATVDDIDLSIQMVRDQAKDESYETFLLRCEDYVLTQNITSRTRSILDDHESDLHRHICKQFSKKNRVSITTMEKYMLTDKAALFYSLLPETREINQDPKRCSGVLDLDKTIKSGKVFLL